MQLSLQEPRLTESRRSASSVLNSAALDYIFFRGLAEERSNRERKITNEKIFLCDFLYGRANLKGFLIGEGSVKSVELISIILDLLNEFIFDR